MMSRSSIRLAALACIPLLVASASDCKCTPDQACWPTQGEWAQFNASIGGQLIRTAPVMQPCYQGPNYDAAFCDELSNSLFYNADYQAHQPLGYDYPVNEACPPPTASNASASDCQLGNSPMYAVNVTSEEHISKAIKFAAKLNIRVVIKSTGHDFLQRSKGFYGLGIWLYHFRGGFEFNDHNPVQETCSSSPWDNSTLTINGMYAWSDIYPTSWEKGLIIVGGNQNGPASTGGWTPGGGHSPVSHNYGMGADQVLSARVVLASGDTVNASPCENPDLFYAIRGGGPGTYGVVTQLTVKTYPTTNVHLFYMVVGAQGTDTVPQFLDVMTNVYSEFPTLSAAGFGGYGYWVANSENGLRGYHFTNVWMQAFTILGKTDAEAQSLFQTFEDEILARAASDPSLSVNITKSAYETYGDYFANKTGTVANVGGISALSSRLLDANALAGNTTHLRGLMDSFGGEPGKPVYHTLVHHGLEATQGLQVDDSATHVGWYESTLLDIFERDVVDMEVSHNVEPFDYIRNKIYPLYRDLSPSAGTYMNEADWGGENWQEDFYGAHWEKLNRVKEQVDPDGVFYCITCVGSQLWTVEDDGALCKTNGSSVAR